MKSIHVVLFLIIIVVISAASIFITYSIEKPPVIVRFIDANILGPNVNIDDVPPIKLAQSVVITVGVERLSSAPINDIMIKTHLTNSENGKLLLIDKGIIHVSPKMVHADYIEYANETKVDVFKESNILGPINIMVTAIDTTAKDFDEIVNVVLYADGKEMDELTFDVVLKNKIN